MKTTVITVDRNMDNKNSYEQAVGILENSGVVAFPTETVYGLGALATDENAVNKIFQAKGRPSDNPLIVHIGTKEEVSKYAEGMTTAAEMLMDAFWPGPLTIVFERIPGVIAPNVTPGVSTVGVRMPDHPVALELLRKLKGPLAAPSANRSGKPSPTEAKHVAEDLDGLIPLILDGGQTGIGLESTVIDMTTTPPIILRPGGVTREMIEEVIGPVAVSANEATEEAPRSPGMKYAHYAPEAPLFIIESNAERIKNAVAQIQADNKKVAVVGPDNFKVPNADWYFAIGSSGDNEKMSASLYKALRDCDLTDADVILATETDLSGVGTAFMNRLLKASNGKRYNS
ncbi:L-threonylcarbamoyladenylate synthase [Sporosarcina sp. G11-34]|uniref:L-threonylcarbamoyladenylate synthase n=1 Tax=Sporosarcina sp. G11-34 TaxID=2849605 RepID=UPI0022A9DCAD|nr:L-threonylcarbamoyladenylate synthase [Sporosarcina sp. G11-34]MCZ2258712.1 threonylcarbamoyl-AMP synthase [Sporosarcina sp. G11-34]